MNDHFMSIADFKAMEIECREDILTALMDAYASRDYISIRIDDENVNLFNVYTMESGLVPGYYEAGGVWSYVNPFTLMKEILDMQ